MDSKTKLGDCLVSVKLLHNQTTVTEKWKTDKSFSCGRHLQMQPSTPNPCVNCVLISSRRRCMGHEVLWGRVSLCVCLIKRSVFMFVCAAALISEVLMPSISCSLPLNNELLTRK